MNQSSKTRNENVEGMARESCIGSLLSQTANLANVKFHSWVFHWAGQRLPDLILASL